MGNQAGAEVPRSLGEWLELTLAELDAEQDAIDEQRAAVDARQAALVARRREVRSQVAAADKRLARRGSRLLAPDTDALEGARGAGRSARTFPSRIQALAERDQDRTWTPRELTDALCGPGASRSALETVRKSSLRLVDRGALRRVDARRFQAVAGQV